MLQGKVPLCYAAFVLRHIDIYGSAEMCDWFF